MKFEETNNVIDIPIYDKCFVYFLLQNDEVVYVGQTHKGLTRPLQHTDKVFDRIKIIYCDSRFLDLTEDVYIEKYKPVYNTFCNYKYDYSLHRIRNSIRQILDNENFNITDLRNILRTLNISTRHTKASEQVSFYEYVKILNYIKDTYINS